jgi:transcriptional regulator with XRE-family HTH domain
MITREKILRSEEYWFDGAQNELFRQLTNYMEREKLTQTDLAKRLGVTKGYVSQILNGNFNYTLKKLVELSISIGMAPTVSYESLESILARENMVKLASITYDDRRTISIATNSENSSSIGIEPHYSQPQSINAA